MSSTFKVTNGDVIINQSNGRPSLIANRDKLRQDIKEFFSVNIMPNGFGSGIEQLIGLIEISPDAFVTMTDRQIRDGVNEFIRLQVSDYRIPRSIDERIIGVSGVIVERDTSDLTKFYFRVNFITADGKQYSVSNKIG